MVLDSKIVTSVVTLAGILSWAFASKECPWLIFVGAIFLGCAADFNFTTNMHVTELAGKRCGTFQVLYTALYDLTGFVLSLVLVLYQIGFHRKWSFLIMCLLQVPGMYNTLFLLPKFKVGNPESQKSDDISNNEEAFDKRKNTTVHSATYYMLSPIHLLHLSWFCLLDICANVYYALMMPWLTDIYPNDKQKVSDLIQVFGYMSIMVILSPLFGHLTDFFRNRYRARNSSNLWTRAGALQYPSFIIVCLGAIFLLLQLGKTDWTIYGTFALDFIFVPAIYAFNCGFISVVFPVEQFGKLIGLQTLVTSCIQLLIYLMLPWAQKTSFNQMRLFLVGITLLCFLHPLSIMFKSRQKQEEIYKKGPVPTRQSFIGLKLASHELDPLTTLKGSE